MISVSLTGSVRTLVPLRLRFALATWFARNRWFPGADRWAEGLVRDLETSDPKRFHKFVWEHHLDRYGLAYQAADLFGSRKLNSTTRAYDCFVADLKSVLARLSLDESVDSVLDVGCSVGHVLRALEEEALPGATELLGIDIDRHAVAAGRAHLSGVDSRVRLLHGDLESLREILDGRRFDLVYAAGSLSYLNEEDATRAVSSILDTTGRLAVFVGLANPGRSNQALDSSVFREEFGRMWTHNFHAMVEGRGWRVVHARWEPPRDGDLQGLYFVFASPGAEARVS